MAHEGGYAPRSPDLSAYHSAPQSSSPPPPPPPVAAPAPAQYQASPFAAPYQPPPYGLGPQQQPQPPLQPLPQAYLAPPSAVPGGLYAQPPLLAPYPAFQQAPPPIMTHYDPSAAADPDFVPDSAGGSAGPAAGGARRGRKPKKLKVGDDDAAGQADCDRPAPGVAEGIDVRTKFPVARIKRIMQADEDVGKVAQVTPTAVSKALELFMISLVTQSADTARGRGSKKVTASHLKQVIQQNSTFDFLSEIVSKVPDAPVPKKELAHKDDDSDPPAEAKKRRGRGKRRADDDDGDF